VGRVGILGTCVGVAVALLACASPSGQARPTRSSASVSVATVVSATATITPIATGQPNAGASATPRGVTSGSATDILAKIATGAPKEYRADLTFTTGGMNPTQATGKIYQEGGTSRVEFTNNGRESIVITDRDAGVEYTIVDNGGSKEAVKRKVSGSANQGSIPTADLQSLGNTGKVLGTDTVGGIPTTVVEFPPSASNPTTTTKVRVWLEKSVPVKIEETSGIAVVDVLFVNYQFGPQPASLFKVPDGVPIVASQGDGAGANPTATP